MKGVTIALITLLLVLGAGPALAADGPDADGNTAAAVDHVVSKPAAGDSSAPLYLETNPDFSLDGGDGDAPSQVLTVWGCDISPQLSFGLEYRADDLTELDLDLALDAVAVKEITQNLLVAFHYAF